MIVKNKHWQYSKYVLRHRWYCFIECCKLKIPFRGLVHDLSKYRPCEWLPYAEHFYGGPHKTREEIGIDYSGWKKHDYYGAYLIAMEKSKESIKENFDKAWLFHQRINKHHWQWWILKYDDGELIKIEMPRVYAKEMVADWRAAGKAINGKDEIIEWYGKNREKIQIHENTRAYIEQLMDYKENKNG
jgi:hypothetical protein